MGKSHCCDARRHPRPGALSYGPIGKLEFMLLAVKNRVKLAVKRPCLHGSKRETAVADARNARHQKYCSEPACRKESQAASHRAWLAKTNNQNYFRGAEHVARVKAWREAHPGYWRRTKGQRGEAATGPADLIALQEVCPAQPVEITTESQDILPPALPDVWLGQPAVVIGFIAHFMGSMLQDDIASSLSDSRERMPGKGARPIPRQRSWRSSSTATSAGRLPVARSKRPLTIQLPFASWPAIRTPITVPWPSSGSDSRGSSRIFSSKSSFLPTKWAWPRRIPTQRWTAASIRRCRTATP